MRVFHWRGYYSFYSFMLDEMAHEMLQYFAIFLEFENTFFSFINYIYTYCYCLIFPAINTFSTPSQRFNFYSLENHKKWTKKILELDISIYSSTFKDKLKVMIHEHWFFILNLSSVIFLSFCIHPIIMFMNSERE